jgi:hypothetical protein
MIIGRWVGFLNFHFFAKVWSLKLSAKNFARDVNAQAKELRMSSRKEGWHCTYAREGKTFRIISDWLIPSLIPCTD